MSAESIRVLIASGFFMTLLLLRLEANRFGAAEYDEPGRRHGSLTRLSWYAIGLTLLAALYVVHPAPHNVLSLVVGPRLEAIGVGVMLGLAGLAQAAAFAIWRYRYLRLPPASAYPDAAVNSIATAVIDEATFRGALLGTLIALGVPGGAAILVATILYVLATRLAAPGRHPYTGLLAFGIGLACGLATLATGGIGAAIVGHAVTSFAVFVCTGHAGQVPPPGREPEELESLRQPPEGWRDARSSLRASRGAEPRDLAVPIGPSGFADRTARRGIPAQHSPGPMDWARPRGRSPAPATQRRSR